MKIKKITQRHFNGMVYNFHCLPDENYFNECVLVHNCYKGNSTDSVENYNMTLQEFCNILDKFPQYKNINKQYSQKSYFLTQIAFGICDVDTNPDMWDMFAESRNRGIIPNYTCNGLGITDDIAERTAYWCGAVAVSVVNKRKTFEAIERFAKAGMKQVNIHYMLSNETMDEAFNVIKEVPDAINAIVFLQYKPKGSGVGHFTSVRKVEPYRRLIEACQARNIAFGFDSCSANIVEKALDGKYKECIEPCESFGMFSSYINCRGVYFPCSFCEGEKHWKNGIDLNECDSFMDIWNCDKLVIDRTIMAGRGRECPIFELTSM